MDRRIPTSVDPRAAIDELAMYWKRLPLPNASSKLASVGVKSSSGGLENAWSSVLNAVSAIHTMGKTMVAAAR